MIGTDAGNDYKQYRSRVLRRSPTVYTCIGANAGNDGKLGFQLPLILAAVRTPATKLNNDPLEYHAPGHLSTMTQR